MHAPDVSRDESVVNARSRLAVAMALYLRYAAMFTNDPAAGESEHELLHMEKHDVPDALRAVAEAMDTFYAKHPRGTAD